MPGTIDSYIDSNGNVVYYDIETGMPMNALPDQGLYDAPAEGGPPVATGDEGLAPPPGSRTTQTAGAGGFTPRGPILDIVKLPGGGAQVVYRAGPTGQSEFDIITPEQYAALTMAASGGGVSPTTLYQQQQIAARDAANLVEDQRQFKETYDYNKAVFNQKAVADAADRALRERQTAEQLDVSRGNTLLGLGSRPDTLIKYLYAIRGQQTPQAISGTTTNLSGYQNIVGQPSPTLGASVPLPTQAAGGGAVAPSSTAPSSAPLLPGREGMLVPQPASLLQNNAANPNYEANLGALASQYSSLAQLLQSARSAPAQTPSAAPTVQAPTITPTTIGFGAQAGQTVNTPIQTLQNGTTATLAYDAPITQEALQNNANLAAGISQITDPFGNTRTYQSNEYADGGPVHEPVLGIGMMSGQRYLIGEKGPETIVPEGKTLAEVKGKRPKSKAYADGGTIGYDPTKVPTLGPNFFNDPNLRTVVERGYNSSPQTPLFPQIGIATGGGQSLIPSMQRLNSLLPSEQSLYAGALQDEFGAQPEDVFALARRLAPNVSGLQTPRFRN